MPSRTWMYKVMDWVATKDMVTLAGLDNTDVAGKQAIVETVVLAATVANEFTWGCNACRTKSESV